MVIVNTWVFILRRYKWHIHAGSWSLVNCLAGSLDKALYRVLMNINECGCRPYGWLGLDGNRCIRVIPRHKALLKSSSCRWIVSNENKAILNSKQKCIPVACVPPALPDRDPLGQRHPGQRPLSCEQNGRQV